MEKTMIMLTKSRKMGHYCVAGIDIRTGEWIRVISEDMSIKQAITEEHMRYYDGSSTSVLDVVKVICKARQPNYYQPENWIIDDRYHWKKIRRSTLQEVIRLCKPCKERYIFITMIGLLPVMICAHKQLIWVHLSLLNQKCYYTYSCSTME